MTAGYLASSTFRSRTPRNLLLGIKTGEDQEIFTLSALAVAEGDLLGESICQGLLRFPAKERPKIIRAAARQARDVATRAASLIA